MNDVDMKLALPSLEAGFSPPTGPDDGPDALAGDEAAKGAADLEAVFDVPVQVSAILGRARMDVGQLLKLGPGAVLELDRKVGEAIDIYVNNRLVARGEVVLVEDKLGVTMTEIIMLESELFGHEKGAFTGAVGRRIGKFEEASGGTLLLDEISEMDVRLQAKLLRALQERVIDRVGGGRPVAVDIRVLATSNRNLADVVREGKFREDLLYRLNVVNLKIPPLRERPADVLELAQYFAKKYAAANGLPVRALSAEARRALAVNRWPGNVRELENTIHRAVLLASGPEIEVDAIRAPDGTRLEEARSQSPAVVHAAFAPEQVTRALVGSTVADVERGLILETLKHCLGNRTHAANILGISIRTLRNKLNEYAGDGVAIPAPGGADMRIVA